MLEWHPTANNVLASAGYDNLVIVWNAARGEEMVRVDCHPDVVTSIRSHRDQCCRRLIGEVVQSRRRPLPTRAFSWLKPMDRLQH